MKITLFSLLLSGLFGAHWQHLKYILIKGIEYKEEFPFFEAKNLFSFYNFYIDDMANFSPILHDRPLERGSWK